MSTRYYRFCSSCYSFCMKVRRGYTEACPVAHSLDIVGDRWAMLVIRELRLGPRRFTDLQAALPHAGPTVLSQRLRELESDGVLHRRERGSVKLYELTPWGGELEPVFRALARWGMRSPNTREGDVTNDTVMLGLRTFWRTPSPAWTGDFTIHLAPDSYHLSIVDGQIAQLFRDETVAPPATVITTDRHTFSQMLNGQVSPTAAKRSGTLTITGDPAPLRHLLAATGKR